MKTISTLISTLWIVVGLNAQNSEEHIFINSNWENSQGTIDGDYPFNQSFYNDNGDLITIGHKLNTQGNADIFVCSFSSSGTINWTYIYDDGADDYGVKILSDGSGGYLLTGTSFTSLQNFNAVVINLNSSGTQQWVYSFDSGDLMAETPTDMEVDNDGSIYVTGIARYVPNSITSNEDFFTLKLSSTGVSQWSQIYDYYALADVPIGIEIDASYAYVAGHCYYDAATRKIALLKYDKSDGSLDDYVFEGGSSNDYATDFVKNANGDLLISGRTIVNGDYLATVLKYNPSLEQQWSYTYDEFDLGSRAVRITTDANNSVYALIETTNPTLGINMRITKLTSSGAVDWYHFMEPATALGAIVPKCLRITNNRLFVGATCAEINEVTYGQYSIFSLDGELIRHEEVRNENNLDFNDIDIYNETIALTGIYNGANYVVCNKLFFAEFDVVLTQTSEKLRYRNIINCKMIGEDLVESYIDNTAMEFGNLSDFFETSLVSAIEGLSSLDEDDFKVMKIFPDYAIADTTDTSYYGVPFRTHDYAYELMIYFTDETVDEEELKDDLANLWETEFAGFVYIPQTASGCGFTNEDTYFSTKQFSLFENSTYPDADIDVCGAWNYSTGIPVIRVAIFDDHFPMYYHADLSINNDFATSVFISGFNFKENIEINKGNISTDYRWHSTSSASVIGVFRNNGKGVSGIAGGDFANSKYNGVSLLAYDNRVPYSANAIPTSLQKGVRAMNMSVEYDFNEVSAFDARLLTQAMNDGIKKGMLFVVARGNSGTSNYNDPACYFRNGLLNVGGAGDDGRYYTRYNQPEDKYLGWGNGMDLIAPASENLIYTASVAASPSLAKNFYNAFNRTSAAAPHVTGVAALIFSKTYNANNYFAIATPNDVEHIIKMSCEDVEYDPDEVSELGGRPAPSTGFDELTGWGLPDARKALEYVDGVNYKLVHFNQNDVSETYSIGLEHGDLEIYIPISYVYEYRADMVGPRFKADIYKVTIVATYSVESGYKLFKPSWYPDGAIWGNQAMTQLKAPPIAVSDGQGGTFYQFTGEPGLIVDNYTTGGTQTVTFVGYIYHLKQRYDASTSTWQTNTFMPWRPFHKGQHTNCAYGFTTHIVDVNLGFENAEIDHQPTLNLYPVPTNDVLNIQLPDILGQNVFSIQVLDVNGKVLLQTEANTGTDFPLSIANLSNGCYVVRASNTNETYHANFIKN